MSKIDIKNNINTVDKGGNTPLHKAADKGNKELCELLLLLMTDEAINKLNNKGVSALHLAAQNYYLKDCCYMIYEKISPEIVNTIDEDGNTLLHYIVNASSGYEDETIELFKFFLSKMNPEIINTVNKDGITILHRCIDRGQSKLAKLIIKGLKI